MYVYELRMQRRNHEPQQMGRETATYLRTYFTILAGVQGVI